MLEQTIDRSFSERLSYQYFTEPHFQELFLESLCAHVGFTTLSLIGIDYGSGQVREIATVNRRRKSKVDSFPLLHFRALVNSLETGKFLVLDEKDYELGMVTRKLEFKAESLALFPIIIHGKMTHVLTGIMEKGRPDERTLDTCRSALPLLKEALSRDVTPLRLAFEENFEASLLIDGELMILEESENARLFLESSDPYALETWLLPDERERMRENLRSLASGESMSCTIERADWRYPLRIKRLKATSIYMVYLDAVPLRKEIAGGPELEDVHEVLLDLVPHHIYVKDDQGRIVYANATHADYLDLPKDQIQGHRQRELHRLMRQDIERFSNEDQEILKTGRPLHLTDERVVDNRGMTHFFETHKIPYENVDGRFILGVSTEITDLVRSQAYLMQKKEELQKSYEDLEAMNEELYSINEELQETYFEVSRLYRESKRTNEGLEALIHTIMGLGDGDIHLDTFLVNAFHGLYRLIDTADYGSLVFFREGVTHYVDAIGHDLEALQKLQVAEEKFIHSDQVVVIEDLLDKNLENQFTRAEFEAMIEASQPIRSSLILSLTEGETMIANVSLDISASEDKQFTEADRQIAEGFKTLVNAYLNQKRLRELSEDFHQHIVLAITGMLEIHDQYTRGHSENVARMARAVGRSFGLSEGTLSDTYWAGMVHDIGKILIGDEVLNKVDPLTDEEYRIIRQHPVWGYETLRASKPLEKIARYVRHHHERWDGRGYPDGLAGDEIPLISQILCVVDAYDAMTSKRSYRDALSFEAATAELKKHSGTQFSPEVVTHFLSLLKETQ
jgi:PAS domain S-box-containing protein